MLWVDTDYVLWVTHFFTYISQESISIEFILTPMFREEKLLEETKYLSKYPNIYFTLSLLEMAPTCFM